MSIVFIAPDEHMAEIASGLAARSTAPIIVAHGLLEAAIPIARKYEGEADVFVSRGGTVMVLRQAGIAAPIVELQITAKDLADALTKARTLVAKDHPRLGIIAYANMTQQLQDFIPLLDLDLRCYNLSPDTDIEAIVGCAVREGVDVLLGGVITTRIAHRLGLPAVLIESGESSFCYALEEAERISFAKMLEKRRTQELKAILDNVSEGVIAVNATGHVTIINPAAKAMTAPSIDIAVGQSILSLAPFFKFAETLSTGEREIGALLAFGKVRVIMNKAAIIVGGHISGAIATLQNVSLIQDMEELIRRESHNKGHYAKFHFEDILVADPLMAKTVAMARRFADTAATVLIKGESGVGKELFAQSIHNGGSRRGRPFVAVNCAALPESLLESELFGYVDGAFTGASKKGKPGLFELAHRGTIFLDEISEIPFSLQGRLLRVLQEQEVMRLGHDRVIPIDVRVIAATNRDLRALIAVDAFRNDLYWRLNVLSLPVPPLRLRPGDILLLIDRMIQQSGLCTSGSFQLTDACKEYLLAYSWPGNVRELKNFCDRISIMCVDEAIEPDRAAEILDSPPVQFSTARSASMLRKLDDTPLVDVVTASSSMAAAAAKLGVHRSTLWRRLKALERARNHF
ncbi:sigma-54-dependent Fis family transcriptional regulator [Treponema sp.]